MKIFYVYGTMVEIMPVFFATFNFCFLSFFSNSVKHWENHGGTMGELR